MKSHFYTFELLALLHDTQELIDQGIPGAYAAAKAAYSHAPELFTAPPVIPADAKVDPGLSEKLGQVLVELASLDTKKHIGVADFVRTCRKSGLWPEEILIAPVTVDQTTLALRCKYMVDNELVIAKIGRNITALALDDELDPVYGRHDEIAQVAQTLVRRQKANPILVADAGVGKTAIVEGLAQRLARGEIKGEISGSVIVEISPAAILSRSENPAQIAQMVQHIVQESAVLPWLILFIDEIHTIFGSKGPFGTDVANLLKPALARHDIRIIGATTPSEYISSVEADHALERRLQRINLSEMGHADTVKLLEYVIPKYELFHQVSVDRSDLSRLVTLSSFYNPNNRQPDCAITFVDTVMACSKLNNEARISEQILASVLAKNENPFLVAMVTKESDRLSAVSKAMDAVLPNCKETTESILAQGTNPTYKKPIASTLVTVSRRGLALLYAEELSQQLYGHSSVIYYDMQEFFDQSTLQRWLGSPSGYIGFDRGGMLITQLNARNNNVLVLDCIELAHPAVLNVIETMMINGYVTDTLGRTAYLTTTTVIATMKGGVERAQLGFKVGEKEPTLVARKPPIVCFGGMQTWPAETVASIASYAAVKHPHVTKEQIESIAKESEYDLVSAIPKFKAIKP